MGPRKGLVHGRQHASCSFAHRQLPSGIIFNSWLLELSAGPEAWKVHPQKPSGPLSWLYSQPGAGLGLIHKEALRDFSQSHSKEEDRVTWAGEGRWEVRNNRMVTCEEERGAGLKEDVWFL